MLSNRLQVPARGNQQQPIFQQPHSECNYLCKSVPWLPQEKYKFQKSSIEGKIHTFFKCIYYRAYSMVGLIIHLMCVKPLQLACN